MTDELITRLERLESRYEIEALVSNYCHGFDKRDFDRFLSIWSDDCVWKIGPPFGDFSGHEGIHEALLTGSVEATFVGATYRDRFARRGGAWKISEREVTIHYFNQFGGTTLSAPEG